MCIRSSLGTRHLHIHLHVHELQHANVKLFAFELAGKETEPNWFPVHRHLKFIWNFSQTPYTLLEREIGSAVFLAQATQIQTVSRVWGECVRARASGKCWTGSNVTHACACRCMDLYVHLNSKSVRKCWCITFCKSCTFLFQRAYLLAHLIFYHSEFSRDMSLPWCVHAIAS
jgi:hypothetical protein